MRRSGQIAQDLVDHYERRQEAQDGKALVVCMSRRICVDLYNAIVALRPQWHDANDAKGAIKVVMTGSASDPAPMQPHVRSKAAREGLAKRFKDPKDALKIVIVPVKYDADGSGRLPDVSATQIELYRKAFHAMYPAKKVEVTVRAPWSYAGTVSPNAARI